MLALRSISSAVRDASRRSLSSETELNRRMMRVCLETAWSSLRIGVRREENVAVEGVRDETREFSRAVVVEMRLVVWLRISEGVRENDGGGWGGVFGDIV